MSIRVLVFLLGLMLAHYPASALEFRSGFTGGNCLTCSWVAAEGPIEDGDVERFLAFIQAEGLEHEKLLRLDSPGGDLRTALKLGEIIREKGMMIIVSRTLDEVPEGAGRVFQFSEPGTCASACVFVMMSGVSRLIQDGSRVGVHQFAPAHDRLGSTSVATSETQSIIALLQTYTERMGVDSSLLILASATPANDMQWLTLRQMEQTNLATFRTSLTLGQWALKPDGGSLTAEVWQQQLSGRQTVFILSCDALYVGFEESGNPASEVVRAIRYAEFRLEGGAARVPGRIVDVSSRDDFAFIALEGGSKIASLIRDSNDMLSLDLVIPRAMLGRFGGWVFQIPTTNIAEVMPHVLRSCR